MMMKILIVFILIFNLIACDNNQHIANGQKVSTITDNYIEVFYFHGKQRCVTCNAIENETREVIENDFSEQLKNGKIIFKVIDISTTEGEKIADKYEVTWSSLFINSWKSGKEIRTNLTDFGFSYAKSSPEVFKTGIKKKINELLK